MSIKLTKIKKEKICELREIVKEKTNRQSFDNELRIISRLSDRPDKIHAYVLVAEKMLDEEINASDSFYSWLETNYENKSCFSYDEITFIILSELINIEELNTANEEHFNLDDDFIDYVSEIESHCEDGDPIEIAVGRKPNKEEEEFPNGDVIRELQKLLDDSINIEAFYTKYGKQSENNSDHQNYINTAEFFLEGSLGTTHEVNNWVDEHYDNVDIFEYDDICYIILFAYITKPDDLKVIEDEYYNVDDDFMEFVKEYKMNTNFIDLVKRHESEDEVTHCAGGAPIVCGTDPIEDLRKALHNEDINLRQFNKSFRGLRGTDYISKEEAFIHAAKELINEVTVSAELQSWFNWNNHVNSNMIREDELVWLICEEFAMIKFHKRIQNHLTLRSSFLLTSKKKKGDSVTKLNKNTKDIILELQGIIHNNHERIKEAFENETDIGEIQENNITSYEDAAESLASRTIDLPMALEEWLEEYYDEDELSHNETLYIILSELLPVDIVSRVVAISTNDILDDVSKGFKKFVQENSPYIKDNSDIKEEKGGNSIPDDKKILVGRKPLEDLQLILKNDEESKDSFTKGVNSLLLKEMDITQMYIDAAREVETYNRVISDELRNWIHWNFNESDNPLLDDEIVYMICLGFTDLITYAGLVKIIEEQLNLREEFLNEYKLLIKKGESFMGKIKNTAVSVGNKAKKAAGKSKNVTKEALIYSGKIKAGNLAIHNIKKAAFSLLFPMLADSNIKIEEDDFMKSSVIDIIIGQSIGYLMNIADGDNKTSEILNLISSCMIMASTQNAIEALQIEKMVGVLTEGIDIEKLKDLSI